MSSIEISFRGLVGLVPKRRHPDEDLSQAVVVLPNVFNGSAGMLDDESKLPGPMAPHTACVVLSSGLVLPDQANREPTLEYRRAGENYLLYALDFENVRLSPGPTDALALVDREIRAEKPADSAENTDLTWLPTLSKSGLPHSGLFNRDLLDRGDLPTDDTIIATISLSGGTVCGLGVRTDALGDPIVYSFWPLAANCTHLPISAPQSKQQGKPVIHQALAPGLRYTAQLPGQEAQLVFSRSGKEETVSLHLPQGRRDRLTFYNYELEQILSIGSASPLVQKVADPDFAAFYRLSAGWPTFQGSPLPIPHVTDDGGRGMVNCEPPKFAGWASPAELDS